MLTIAVLNQKGGSGKTTIATNLARAFQLENQRVAIIDADPQGTASEWSSRHDETPPVYGANTATIHNDLPALSDAFDIAIIDGAPSLQDRALSAVKAADLVLIPVRPSAADIWASEDVVDMAQARRQATGAPDVAFVVSQQVARSNLASTVQDALSGFDVDVMESRTSHRVAYAEALGAGRSVLDVPDAKKAANEIQQLARETLNRLKNQDGYSR
jgi:chromosome partitioning protein